MSVEREIIIFRHGNTFEGEETPFFCGRHEDLPLTTRGIEQALEGAATMKSLSWIPDVVFAAPLSRTRVFAETIISELDPSISITTSENIIEIDYGHWAGLSDEQICKRYGEQQLLNWREDNRYPDGVFAETYLEVEMRLRQFFIQLLELSANQRRILIVTSNGLLKLLPGVIEKNFCLDQKNETVSVRTGNLCALKFIQTTDTSANFIVSIQDWNVSPLAWTGFSAQGHSDRSSHV